jgi:dTMP kinase
LKQRGLLITLEGIDGSGKSTQLRLLADYLKKRGLPVKITREPGGTREGEQIRGILLSSETRRLDSLAELLLMYAARAQHLAEVVKPALQRGQIVISDRYNDASLAYQGYGRQLGTETVRAFDRVVCGKLQPDLTLLLDLPARQASRRAQKRAEAYNSDRGRFEAAGVKFHERVRAGYRALARQEPRRVKLIRADRPVGQVQAEIRQQVETFLSRRGRL